MSQKNAANKWMIERMNGIWESNMSGFMDKERYRKKHDRLSYSQPSRLERKLAKVELTAISVIEESRAAGGSKIAQFLYFFAGLIGMIIALLSTLLGLGLTLIPILLLYSCVSQF